MKILKFFIVVFFSFTALLNGNVKPAQEQADGCLIVIFGATGDLTARKLLPALYHLEEKGQLSQNTAIIGVARKHLTHEAFRSEMRTAIDQFSQTTSKTVQFWENFQKKIFYHPLSFTHDEDYTALKIFLDTLELETKTGNRLYYLATQPSYFSDIIQKLHSHQLIYTPHNPQKKWSRVVIEKPFGHDLASAEQLQNHLTKYLDESQIYRMDHYLGKEAVQQLIQFRFNAGRFTKKWNRHSIDHVDITLSEELGIGTRAHFWEETGALRDLLQNHLMQLLALVAMEPPLDLKSEMIHAEKIKVLNSISPFPEDAIDKYVVRGQYGPGMIKGVPVVGYRQEKDVPATSNVETFVSATFLINNARWQGVPFYLSGGKRLSTQKTEIAVHFKEGPPLIVRIQPNPIITYGDEILWQSTSPQEAYEKLLSHSIKGDQSLFVKGEEQLISWRLLDPILKNWQTAPSESFPNYPAGSAGPKILCN